MSKLVEYSRNINVSAEAVEKGGSRVVYVSAEQLDLPLPKILKENFGLPQQARFTADILPEEILAG